MGVACYKLLVFLTFAEKVMVIAIAGPARLHLSNDKPPEIFARSVITIFLNGFKSFKSVQNL